MSTRIGAVFVFAIAACGAPATVAPGAATTGHASIMEVGALTGTLPDLDAPTLATMTARAGCAAQRDASTRYVCGCMAAFAAGDRAALADGARLIGVGAQIHEDGSIDPTLELLAFEFHRPGNFHEEVELGDTATSIPVIPQTPDEARQIADATAALVAGRVVDNPAVAFARTMALDLRNKHLIATDGASAALGTRTRMLVRGHGDTIVVIETSPTNAKAARAQFYVQCFTHP